MGPAQLLCIGLLWFGTNLLLVSIASSLQEIAKSIKNSKTDKEFIVSLAKRIHEQSEILSKKADKQ